jgi:type VI secretion system secreted protein VgrG
MSMTNNTKRYLLKINDAPIIGARIEALTIRQELGEHWWCDVAFRLEQKPNQRRRPRIEDYLGRSLEFVVYGKNERPSTLFKGFVLEGELEYGIHDTYKVIITGVTQSYKLQLTPEEHYFYDKNLKGVAEELMAEDGLTLDFKDDGQRNPMNYVQWGDTDFDFIKRLADDEGYFLRPTHEGLEIRRGFEEDVNRPPLQWHVEGGLLKFSIKGRLGHPSFEGTTYVYKEMKCESPKKVKKTPKFFEKTVIGLVDAVTSRSEQLPSGRMNFDGRAPTFDMYRKLLEKESARSIGSKIIGHGMSQDYHLKPGDKIRLAGPGLGEGKDFDAVGEYGLISVIHTYNPKDGYRNEFTVTLWKEYTNAEQPPRALIHGVVPARVADIEDDEGGGCAIRVKYDWMKKNAKTGWIRMTTPCAGGGRGIMFRPQKGDEVLVAFTHGDPERPYVIGALWNGVDRPPAKEPFHLSSSNGESGMTKAARKGDLSRIVTKNGNVIQLVDVKGQEAITITTPKGQKIQMLDCCEETKKRSILALTSPEGDIILNAPKGRVHIRSKLFSKKIG